MSSSPLLHLDLTSEDTLYSTDSIHNQYLSPWLQSGNKHSESPRSMHVNVTLNSPSNQRHLSEQTAPFPYSSSFNYYYNQPAATTCTATSLVELHGSSSEDWTLEPLLSPQLVIKNSTSKEPFDPHIDDFEIVRAKVTGITRVMQKYHVEALEEPISPVSSILSHHVDHPCDTNNSRPLSPLSILCPTTNLLIQSRTESYLQEQEQEEDEKDDDALWRNEFLKLMSNIITYSEDLESISTELLRTEGRVRELVLLQKQMEELYEEREKAYKDRLEECHQASQQQLNLINHLQELDRDLDIHQGGSKVSKQPLQKMPLIEAHSMNATPSLLSSAATTLTTTSTIYQEQRQQSSEQSWNRSTLLNDLSTQHTKSINDISAMEDLVHTLRWEVGLRIGGGVGTGHVIHSFEGPLSGIELIIAGSGIIASSATPQHKIQQQEESFTLSSSIQHLRFHKHHYVVHINHRDRETRFRLLPKSAWIPDQLVNQCQFRTCQTACKTEFNLFQRRHHCRRCGIIICQRHGLNRLPLFANASTSTTKWHRVCDGCFYELIIVKTADSHIMNDSAADLSELV